MVLPADGGGDSSLGDLPALEAAGGHFRTFANVVTGIAQTPNLQSGGQFEHEMLAADDANVGASTTSFQTSMGSLSRAFLEALIAAAPQLADAAVDLFDSADAFATADTVIPANAQPYGHNIWIVPDSTGPSAPSIDDTTHATVYYLDREGNVVVKDRVPTATLPGPPVAQSPPAPSPGPAPTPSPGPASTR